MSNAVLNPYSTTKPRELPSRSKIMGLMDDDFERQEVESRPDSPNSAKGTLYFNKPAQSSIPTAFQEGLAKVSLDPDIIEEVSQIAETTFNSFSNLAQSSTEAALDLGKQIFGFGEKIDVVSQAEQIARNAQENPSSVDTTVVPPDHETNALKLQSIRNFLKKLENDQSQIVEERKMSESLRIDDKILTDGDTAGTTKDNLFTVANMHNVARAKSEAEKASAEGQKEASIATTNPKGAFSIHEGDLINHEGGSQFGGVGDKGGPG